MKKKMFKTSRFFKKIIFSTVEQRYELFIRNNAMKKQYSNIFICVFLKCQFTIVYPVNISFKRQKFFSDIHKLKIIIKKSSPTNFQYKDS